MQIDGIRLLRFTMRELGIPEHKVRNAIRYLDYVRTHARHDQPWCL